MMSNIIKLTVFDPINTGTQGICKIENKLKVANLISNKTKLLQI